jgi:hypothetical protein
MSLQPRVKPVSTHSGFVVVLLTPAFMVYIKNFWIYYATNCTHVTSICVKCRIFISLLSCALYKFSSICFSVFATPFCKSISKLFIGGITCSTPFSYLLTITMIACQAISPITLWIFCNPLYDTSTKTLFTFPSVLNIARVALIGIKTIYRFYTLAFRAGTCHTPTITQVRK